MLVAIGCVVRNRVPPGRQIVGTVRISHLLVLGFVISTIFTFVTIGSLIYRYILVSFLTVSSSDIPDLNYRWAFIILTGLVLLLIGLVCIPPLFSLGLLCSTGVWLILSGCLRAMAPEAKLGKAIRLFLFT